MYIIIIIRGRNGRSARHHNLNDLVWQGTAKVDIPALKEPSGLLSEGKQPRGVTSAVETRKVLHVGRHSVKYFMLFTMLNDRSSCS